MGKQSGLGDRFFLDGLNLSGDIGSLSRIGGGLTGTQDITGIDKSAFERAGLIRDGSLEFTAFFNPDTDRSHEELSPLPTDSRLANYYRGFTQGVPAAGLLGKQVNYDPTRNQDGSLTIGVQIPSTDFGLEWGVLLSDGDETETAVGSGAALDLSASTNFGLQAYLQVSDGTVGVGETVDISVQDSADGSTGWVDVANFTQITDATVIPLAERVQTLRTDTIRQFLRWNVVGTFTSITFNIMVMKNTIETLF
jgi:hypothetical protein